MPFFTFVRRGLLLLSQIRLDPRVVAVRGCFRFGAAFLSAGTQAQAKKLKHGLYSIIRYCESTDNIVLVYKQYQNCPQNPLKEQK